TFAHAGYDLVPTPSAPGGSGRLGQAVVPLANPDQMFPEMRFPTAEDTLSFGTARGAPGAQVIELAQTTDAFTSTGIGLSAMALDPARGMLYVTSKLQNDVYVVDIRNDSDGSFVDSNYLDLETLLSIDTGTLALGTSAGFRDVLLAPGRDLLFLTQ